MVRTAALAACLLALAMGAAAGPREPTCTTGWSVQECIPGHLKLEFMGPRASTDKIATCLTSMRLDLAADCSVKITSLQNRGSLVPSLWSAEGSYDAQNFVECPDFRPAVAASFGTGTRLEAVRNAVIKALSSYVYGLDDYAEPINPIDIPDLDFFEGKLVVKRTQAPNLIYAITEADVSDCDMRLDDDYTPLGEISTCLDLSSNNPDLNVRYLCLDNAEADARCPANSYGVLVVEDGAVNAWNEQLKAFKVCGLCPAGTAGDGYGCTSCKAGEYSIAGGEEGCKKCPEGTYSNAGSSVCIPCPMGTYSNIPGGGAKECVACPEDTYSWIPGATACLRCIDGVPTKCEGGACTSENPSTQTTHIVDVSAMGANDGACNLGGAGAGPYEIKSFTKCQNWATSMNLAFTVYGDCSIQISPISDPSCSIPTSEIGYQYGAVQQRAYYYFDEAKGSFAIRSLFDTTRGVTKTTILQIVNEGGLKAKWFPVTIDANEAYDNGMIRDLPGPSVPEVCTADMDVLGGTVLGVAASGVAGYCPPGSFYHKDEVCPICPVGFTCKGGPAGPQTKVPCPANTYNDMLGLSAPCTGCPAAAGADLKFTSYAAAEQCGVQRLNMTCDGNRAISQAFDLAAQACLPCPAGTQRIYVGEFASNECQECPVGTSSKEGDFCMDCPAGEYSPSPGLANQEGTLGTQCIKCTEGSISLVSGNAAEGSVSAMKAGLCDACPPGSYEENNVCVRCPANTYRSGDATPENNKCNPIPAGYKYTSEQAAATRDNITWCAPGTVSNYGDEEPTTQNAGAVRIPTDGTMCLACTSDLLGDAVNTFAPRKGMTKCIPCPAGTLPKTVNGATTSCAPCGDGTFRDAYDPVVGNKCTDCGAGFEVGPSSKMKCEQCRPGTYLDSAMATENKNNCELCRKNTYRPTFGATSCLQCPRGTQTSDKGNVECTACPIGYYNNKVESDCLAAPAGTFVNTTGAFITTPCPKGSWNNEQAQDNCNPCAPGKYSNTLGSKECKTCPAGTYSAGQATTCLDCRKGYAAPAGAAACAPCKPGTYAPNTKSATCKLCPKGFQCPTNAMQKEGACPRGTFSNKEGNRLCTPCPVNTMSQGGGVGAGGQCSNASPCPVMACMKCPPGTNTRGLVGQSRCQVIRPQVRRLGL